MVTKFDLRQLPPSPDLSFEQAHWAVGCQRVAGVDEAGRGALAGPVAAGAVILPADPAVIDQLAGVRDSKVMTPFQRSFWAGEIRRTALACGVGFATSQEIDRLGILPATRLAMERAIATLGDPPQHLLVDYLVWPGCPLSNTLLVKGDARSLSIAAASVLAKTVRDELLCRLDEKFPGYGLSAHKGYGTRQHLEALDMLGPSPIHRRSFAPCRSSELAD